MIQPIGQSRCCTGAANRTARTQCRKPVPIGSIGFQPAYFDVHRMRRWRGGLDQSGANDVPHRLIGGDLPSDGNRSEHTSQAVGRERLHRQTRPQHKAIGRRITCRHPQRKWIATPRQ